MPNYLLMPTPQSTSIIRFIHDLFYFIFIVISLFRFVFNILQLSSRFDNNPYLDF